MRILVVENEPSSQRGGQEWCLLDNCRGLAKQGHQVSLIYLRSGDFLDEYRQFCTDLVQVHCFRMNRDRPIGSAWDWIRSIYKALKFKPDVIYTNHYNDIFFTALIAALKHVPLICHLHVFPPNRFGIQCELALRLVTGFITVSQATRAAYLKAGFAPDSVEVVYNGIDLEHFNIQPDRLQTRKTLGISAIDFVILYAGRIDPPKNIEMLLSAFAQLVTSHPHAKLCIAGWPLNHATPEAGARYVRSLQQQCDQLKIINRVQWLGPRGDLPAIYRAADVTVLPSLLPDTFGRVLAESMACGTPAIGLRYGGIPEVLAGEFQRFQFEVGDIAGLADLLRSLDGWQQQDPTLGNRCRQYVEQRFSVQQAVSEINAVFHQVQKLGPVRSGPTRQVLHQWNGAGTEFCERS